MLLTFTIGLTVANLFGFDNIVGVYFGLLLAFSSTMIVTKLLVDRDEINTLHGRIMLAILLFQDVVAIVAIPLLSNVGSLISIDFVAEIVLKGVGFYIHNPAQKELD